MQRLIEETGGKYLITKAPTHKSKSHDNTWSHLDGAIASDDIKILEMRILTPADFPEATRDHYPIKIEMQLAARAKKPKEVHPEPNSWPFYNRRKIKWGNMNLEKYSLLSEYLTQKAENIIEDLPWTIKFKVLNDMMAEAAIMSENPKVLRKDKQRMQLEENVHNLRQKKDQNLEEKPINDKII